MISQTQIMPNINENINEDIFSEGNPEIVNVTDVTKQKEPRYDREITKQFIISLDPKVRKVDGDDNVELYCYTSCSPDDSDIVKSCRGLVFQGDNLVLKAFSYTREYTVNDIDEFDNRIDDTSRFFKSKEGTVIRVFYIANKWYVSTNRRLDAFRSKWSSKHSFGEIFVSALYNLYRCSQKFVEMLGEQVTEKNVLQRFLECLDTSMQYMFLIENIPSNRIVCKAPSVAGVYHVGTYTPNGFSLDIDINVPFAEELQFHNMDELCSYIQNDIDISESQGVIVFRGDEQFKILNSEYLEFYKIRGNEASVKYRYLQLRMDSDAREKLMYLYPEHIEDFDRYEDVLYELLFQIKNAYIKRFINRQEFVTMPPEEYQVMKQIHAWHIEDRTKNHISTSIVRDFLNQQPPSKLNRMIRRYLNEERVKSNE